MANGDSIGKEARGFAVDMDDDQSATPIVFHKEWFVASGYRPSALYGVKVSGASMEPALWDGDIAIINTDDTTPRDGEVFAVNFEGEMVIKRLRRDAGVTSFGSVSAVAGIVVS